MESKELYRHFTIYDFVKAHELFSNPEWDGEPAEVGNGGDKVFPPIEPRPQPYAKQPRPEYEVKKKCE